MIPVCGIDPGKSGAIVLLMPIEKSFDPHFFFMPQREDGGLDYEEVLHTFHSFPSHTKVFLERAIPMAQGSKSAFSYGRDFGILETAIQIAKLSVSYVEPAKWTKIMHEGISKDLKPKAKSLIAIDRLFPTIKGKIPVTPKSQKMHEGAIDALLIAGYGMRNL